MGIQAVAPEQNVEGEFKLHQLSEKYQEKLSQQNLIKKFLSCSFI
jgi:hypothetical protein